MRSQEAPFYAQVPAGLQAAVAGHWPFADAWPPAAGGYDFADVSLPSDGAALRDIAGLSVGVAQ